MAYAARHVVSQLIIESGQNSSDDKVDPRSSAKTKTNSTSHKQDRLTHDLAWTAMTDSTKKMPYGKASSEIAFIPQTKK